MATPGISTLGIKFGYALETTAGTQPTAFTQLTRCNNIGGISLSTEQIDASALEDYITRYTAGRQDSGGEWPVSFNLTDDTMDEISAMISAFTGRSNTDLSMWFVVWSPYLTDAFYVTAEPPKYIPMPEIGQNELQTVELTLTINEYKGPLEAIEPA